MRRRIAPKKDLLLLFLVPVLVGAASLSVLAACGDGGDQEGFHRALQTLGGELRFEENSGQSDPRVRFLARGPGYTLFLTATEAVLKVPGAPNKTKAALPRFLDRAEVQMGPPDIWRQRLVAGNPNPEIEGLEPLPGKSNYFIGSDTTRWRTNVTQYARVRYRDVYPGIDLVYYGRAGQLEYDFIVSPGADPDDIRLAVSGGSVETKGARARVDASGDLVLATSSGELRLRRPEVYQEDHGRRQTIAARYVLPSGDWTGAFERSPGETTATFAVAAYDRSRPLLIDPVLIYSTYLGGSSEAFGTAIAVDAEGHAYVTRVSLDRRFSHRESRPTETWRPSLRRVG